MPVFEDLRRSLDELLQRATKPEDRRSVLARMKATIVQATIGVDDVRDALSWSQKKLAAELGELATVRRRKELAIKVNDAETMAVADRFEKQHADKIAMLEEKVAVQTRELELAERELGEMKAELRTAMAGGGAAAPAGAAAAEGLDDPLADESGAKVAEEIDSLARQRKRADHDDNAQRLLDEMKKKMGK